ncbi:putative NCP1-NADPH-cytochrome P450 reductase [Fusarium proliferatum ET1]|uniref:NADPH--cytochrome P450 reductase n=1 Tax=Fusarium proliferatum (strain ET1) TaxID=1227346 RepID=A0A1L7VTE5_FUSPR|nr:putative NCP1-NADPH-cytochrome P450 reductase [Fusarium proliferatum ET1]CZR43692.1 probable NCP1-NADPH-cytochrome P450 reductase [Fusarium proliferatum ET1]
MEAETVTAPGDVPVFDVMTAVLTAVLVSLIAYFGHGPLHELLFQTSTKTKSLGADSDDESDVSSDKCIVKRLEEEEKNCVVLFGSQSGNAQEFAEKLGREAHTRFSLRSIVAEIDDYTYQNLHKLPENTIVFFILASYGDGEPTDNSEQFYNFLTDEDDDGPFDRLREHGLQNLSYSAFGLGNSSYAHFNAVVRKVDERLQLCGARRLGPVGEADDGKGTNAEDFIEWKDKMWPQVMEAFGLVERDAGEREPAFEVVEIPNHHGPIFQADYTDRNLAQQAQAVTNHYFAPISDSRLLSDAGGRSYIHVELDIKDSKLDYQTGDHLLVSPINSDVEVERFLRVFGLWDKRHETIRARSLSDDVSPPFPSPCSYESAARFYIDICGPVSREVVSAFANSVSNAKQKTMLRQLGKDKEAFLALTEGSYYNVASMMETLFLGETVDVPFAIIIEAMPKLQPRYYSISSSSALEADRVSITVAIESFLVTNTNRHFSGVATNFILDVASIEDDVISSSRVQPITYSLPTKRPHLPPSLSVCVRTSTFRLPSDPTIPILMVGPGTGVAPFRGFVRERVAMHRQGTRFAPMTLLYGCRKRTEDFLYEKEWKAYASELGSKFRMYTAFSREQKHKVYVQDLILQQSKDIASLIQNGGHVYVCGDVGMGRGVTETLCKVLASETSMSLDDSQRELSDMRHSHRYQEDVW